MPHAEKTYTASNGWMRVRQIDPASVVPDPAWESGNNPVPLDANGTPVPTWTLPYVGGRVPSGVKFTLTQVDANGNALVGAGQVQFRLLERFRDPNPIDPSTPVPEAFYCAANVGGSTTFTVDAGEVVRIDVPVTDDAEYVVQLVAFSANVGAVELRLYAAPLP